MDWPKTLRHGRRSGKVYRGNVYYIWKAHSREGERHIVVASERRKRRLGGHRCSQADLATSHAPSANEQMLRWARQTRHSGITHGRASCGSQRKGGLILRTHFAQKHSNRETRRVAGRYGMVKDTRERCSIRLPGLSTARSTWRKTKRL